MEKILTPKILQCNKFVSSGYSFDKRVVRDYEFDFYIDGERNIYIDNHNYNISKGCMVFKKPGQITSGDSNYNMYMLSIDFSNESNIPPEKYIRSSSNPQQKICTSEILNDIPEVFYPYHQAELQQLLKLLCSFSYPNIINEEMQNKVFSEFILLLLSDVYRYNRASNPISYRKKTYIEQACNYINKNYSQNLTITVLANYLSLNKNYLIKLFKKEMSTTPNQYIKQTRLYYAKLMLIQTELSVENIGLSCGFNTPSYFIKCFKENFGISPLTYRNNNNLQKRK